MEITKLHGTGTCPDSQLIAFLESPLKYDNPLQQAGSLITISSALLELPNLAAF